MAARRSARPRPDARGPHTGRPRRPRCFRHPRPARQQVHHRPRPGHGKISGRPGRAKREPGCGHPGGAHADPAGRPRPDRYCVRPGGPAIGVTEMGRTLHWGTITRPSLQAARPRRGGSAPQGRTPAARCGWRGAAQRRRLDPVRPDSAVRDSKTSLQASGMASPKFLFARIYPIFVRLIDSIRGEGAHKVRIMRKASTRPCAYSEIKCPPISLTLKSSCSK